MNAEALSHALAGSAGGVAAMSLLYPLTAIQLRLSVQVKKLKSLPPPNHSSDTAETKENESHCCTSDAHQKECIEASLRSRTHHCSSASSCATPASTHSSTSAPLVSLSVSSGRELLLYKGMVDCGARMVWEEGWRSLYRGLSGALIGVAASSAIYFYWSGTVCMRPSIYLSVYLSFNLSAGLSIYHSIYLSVYQSLCLSFNLSLCPIDLSICLSINMSGCLSIYQSIICQTVSLCICLSIILSISLSVKLSICLSINLSIDMILFVTSVCLSSHLSVSFYLTRAILYFSTFVFSA